MVSPGNGLLSEPLHYHRILLVRARPGSGGSRSALRRAEEWAAIEPGRLLVFFHGDGVEHAADGEPTAEWRRLAGWHGASLAVCSGSWQRRHQSALPEPFELSSLPRFWNHALEAGQVACFGQADER